MSTQPIRRILVPLDISVYSQAATLRACEIARAHGAEVSGLVVLDTPEIASSIPPGELIYWPVIHDTVANLTADARDRMAEARKKFAATCDQEGVIHRESELEGVPSEKILESAALFDLVVMGLRTYFHFETRDGPGNSLAEVLGRTVTPVLAVPVPPSEHPAPFRKVAIAFDGSFSASRALRDFAAFAAPYSFDVTVVCAHEDERQARHLLDAAAACLNAHGLESVDTQAVSGSGPDLPDSTALSEADLIVSGIHARHLFKDLFVGSFTKAAIERGETALFMSH